MRDVRLMKRDSTALSKHAIQSEHEIDWENSEILDLENDYAKRKFSIIVFKVILLNANKRISTRFYLMLYQRVQLIVFPNHGFSLWVAV